MSFTLMPRLTAAILGLVLAQIPIIAAADGHATGSYAVIADSGETVLGLDLIEDGGRISGSGVVPDGGLAHGPGIVDIRLGARLGDDLQLNLRLDAHDPALPVASARMTIKDGTAVRLIYRGEVTNGTLTPVSAGSITVPDAPVAPAPAPEPAPEPVPAPATVPEPAPAPAPEPAPVEAAASCIALDQLTTSVAVDATPDVMQEIDSIAALYGLSPGSDRTEAKCQGALAEVTIFLEDFGAGDQAEACYAVAGVLEDIAKREADFGTPASNQPDLLMSTAGMVTASNPGGADTAESCARALTGLYGYLDSLEPAAMASDSGDSIDLPPGYRVEPVINVNLTGNWALAAGGDTAALFSQGRSTVVYEKGPGNRRTVWYWEPRPALRNAGVTKGTLLLEGTRDRGRMSGEARHYVADCGVYVFPIEGRIRDRETEIRVTGSRPDVNDACAITGFSDVGFRLAFVADNPPGERNLNVVSATPSRGNSTPDFGVWALQYQVRNVDRGGGLNVRRNPASNARILGELPHNARGISILGEGCTPSVDQVAFDRMSRRERNRVLSNRWCRIRWADQTGWVYGRYLAPMRQ